MKVWEPNPNATREQSKAFGNAIGTIDLTLKSMLKSLEPQDEYLELRAHVQQPAVELGKLLPIGRHGGNLLAEVIQDLLLHPLQAPTEAKPFIKQFEFEMLYCKWITEPKAMQTLRSMARGSQRGIFHPRPAEVVHTTKWQLRKEIHPMHGIKHTGEGFFQTEERLFQDYKEPTIDIGAWGSQPLYETITEAGETKQFTLLETIRYIRNTEGAHSDTSKRKEREIALMDVFGDADSFSYPHWVIILTAVYLRNEYVLALERAPEHWKPYVDQKLVLHLTGKLPEPKRMRGVQVLEPKSAMTIYLPDNVSSLPTEGQRHWLHRTITNRHK